MMESRLLSLSLWLPCVALGPCCAVAWLPFLRELDSPLVTKRQAGLSRSIYLLLYFIFNFFLSPLTIHILTPSFPRKQVPTGVNWLDNHACLHQPYPIPPPRVPVPVYLHKMGHLAYFHEGS